MSQTFFSYLKVEVPAGELRRYSVTGKNLYIQSASHPFFLELDNSGEVPASSGLGLGTNGDELFKEVIVRNDSDDTLTASLYFGMGLFLSTNDSILTKDAPTVAVPTDLSTNGNSLLASEEIILDGTTTTAGAGQRKALIVFNGDTTETLEIYQPDGTTGVRCGLVYPKTSLILESSDSFGVKNPALVSVPAAILEIFYQKLPGT